MGLFTLDALRSTKSTRSNDSSRRPKTASRKIVQVRSCTIIDLFGAIGPINSNRRLSQTGPTYARFCLFLPYPKFVFIPILFTLNPISAYCTRYFPRPLSSARPSLTMTSPRQQLNVVYRRGQPQTAANHRLPPRPAPG
jgi:hypothetical protein